MSPLKTKLQGFAATGLALSSALALAVAPNTFAEGSSSYFDLPAAQCVVDNYNNTTGSSVANIEEVDFNQVTTLDCANRGITLFRGIVLFPNLEYLDLSGNTALYSSSMNGLDFSQNTKLKYLNLDGIGGSYAFSLDLSHNPDIEYLATDTGSSKSSHYLILSKGIEKVNDNDEYAYGFNLNSIKFYDTTDGNSYYVYVDSTYYPYVIEDGYMLFKDSTKIPYSITMYTENGLFSVSTRAGYMNYRLFFEGDEEIETHNPITINNNCEVREGYGYNGGIYYYCSNTVYEGDEIDTNAIRTNYLDKIFNLANYELSKVEIVPPTANVELSIDTDIQKKGIILGDANFTLDFHFAIKSNDVPSTPSAPNTGLFTKDDGSANVENILLALAGLSVAAFLVLGASRRFSARSRARKF